MGTSIKVASWSEVGRWVVSEVETKGVSVYCCVIVDELKGKDKTGREERRGRDRMRFGDVTRTGQALEVEIGKARPGQARQGEAGRQGSGKARQGQLNRRWGVYGWRGGGGGGGGCLWLGVLVSVGRGAGIV